MNIIITITSYIGPYCDNIAVIRCYEIH